MICILLCFICTLVC